MWVIAPECYVYRDGGACAQLARTRTAGRPAGRLTAARASLRTEELLRRINGAYYFMRLRVCKGGGVQGISYCPQRRGGGRRRPWRSHLALSLRCCDISFLRFHTADAWAVPYLDGWVRLRVASVWP